MRENLRMEAEHSMEAVYDRSYDISCHLQWNVHGADTSSIPTWNHMLFAVKSPRLRRYREMRATPAAAARHVSVLTSERRTSYARESGSKRARRASTLALQ